MNSTNITIGESGISDYSEWLPTLAVALAARDLATWEHSVRVNTFAVALGQYLGLSWGDLKLLRLGALLHDIGKIGIRDSILLKPGALTDEEYNVIRKHPEIGVEILTSSPTFFSILPIIYSHHERYDGKGYPQGLAGQTIPLLARVVCLADAYEVITSNRTYRSAKPTKMALEEIRKNLGSQFDPVLGQAFITMIEETSTNIKVKK